MKGKERGKTQRTREVENPDEVLLPWVNRFHVSLIVQESFHLDSLPRSLRSLSLVFHSPHLPSVGGAGWRRTT